MDLKNQYEAEILVLFSEVTDFLETLEKTANKNTLESLEYKQISIYLDTLDYQVLRKNSSYCMHLSPDSHNVYNVLKFGRFFIRKELGEKVSSKLLLSDKVIQELIKITGDGGIKNKLVPTLCIKQERIHKIISYNNEIIHLSFDKVRFSIPERSFESSCYYMLEVEGVSEKGITKLTDLKLNEYLDKLNINQYYRVPSPSKYLFGLKELKLINLSIEGENDGGS